MKVRWSVRPPARENSAGASWWLDGVRAREGLFVKAGDHAGLNSDHRQVGFVVDGQSREFRVPSTSGPRRLTRRAPSLAQQIRRRREQRLRKVAPRIPVPSLALPGFEQLRLARPHLDQMMQGHKVQAILSEYLVCSSDRRDPNACKAGLLLYLTGERLSR